MENLIGNKRAYGTLAAYLRGGRLPHAIMIEGPVGSGKRTFAREIALAALCSDSEKPCGNCKHCLKIKKHIHPDVLVFGGDGGSRSFHIETVREIRAQASVRPNEADAKIFILTDVQDMSAQAQNALLKIIEEPPAAVRFILTCTNKSLMLETILSRVAVISLDIPSAGECAKLLSLIFPDEDNAVIAAAAEQAGGNVGLARAALGDGAAADYSRRAKKVLDSLLFGSELDALEELRAYEKDRQGFLRFLAMLRAHTSAQIIAMKTSSRISPLRLHKIIAIIDEISDGTAGNVSGLLLTTVLCSKIKSALQ